MGNVALERSHLPRLQVRRDMSKACPKCREDNPPHASFCLACGQRLTLESPVDRGRDQQPEETSQEPEHPRTPIAGKPSSRIAPWSLIAIGLFLTVVSSAFYYEDVAAGIAQELGKLTGNSVLFLIGLSVLIKFTAKKYKPDVLWCFAVVFVLYATVGSIGRMNGWYTSRNTMRDLKTIGRSFLESGTVENNTTPSPSPFGVTSAHETLVRLVRELAHDLESDAVELDAAASKLDLERMLSTETLSDINAINAELRVLQSYETACLQFIDRVQQRRKDIKSKVLSLSIPEEEKRGFLLGFDSHQGGSESLNTMADSVRSFVQATRAPLEFMAARQGRFSVIQGRLFFESDEDVEKYNAMVSEINVHLARLQDMQTRVEKGFSTFLDGL